MAKNVTSNPQQLLTIGEVARSLGLTRRIILNYETRGLLAPDVKEGPAGNRYYTTDTLTRIRMIRIFQNLGLSLDEISSYFNDQTELEPLIRRLETMRDELNLSIEKLKARQEDNSQSPRLITLPRQTVYRRTFRAETIEQRKEHLRQVIPPAMRQYGSDTSKRMFFIEYPLEDPNLISYCIAIPEGSTGEFVTRLPEVRALYITWHGDYDELPAVRESILAWAAARDQKIAGTCRHIYLEGPAHHTDKNRFITQVAVPLAVEGNE